MNTVIFIAGVLFCMALFGVGYKSGSAVAGLEIAQQRAGELDKIVVRDKIIQVEVPKIVTRVSTITVTKTNEVDNVILKSSEVLSSDCTMPLGYSELLIAAAKGIEPSTGGSNGPAGEYGCREVLTATLKDLKAGWINSSRLEGLQERVNLNKGD